MVTFVHVWQRFEEQLLTFYIGIIVFTDAHMLWTDCKFYTNIDDNNNDKTDNNGKPRKLSMETQSL